MESSELGLFLVRTRKMFERLLRPEHDVLLKKMLFPKGEFRMRWFQCHFARERLLLFVRNFAARSSSSLRFMCSRSIRFCVVRRVESRIARATMSRFFSSFFSSDEMS